MESPTTELADCVDCRNPQGAGCGNFFFLLFFLPAADFQHKVEHVLTPMPIIDMHNEIRDVFVRFTIDALGDGEAQAFILDVMDDLGHILKALGNLLFPDTGVTNHMRDVAAVCPRAVDRLGGVKIDIAG